MYADPKAFSRKVRIPLRLSEIWCAHQLKLSKVMEAAKFCPKCNQPTLEIESGSYEENTRDYVYCSNDEIPITNDGEQDFTECDYTAEPTQEHEALNYWYDFDVLWAMSCDAEMWKREYGSLQNWLAFVRREVGALPIGG